MSNSPSNCFSHITGSLLISELSKTLDVFIFYLHEDHAFKNLILLVRQLGIEPARPAVKPES